MTLKVNENDFKKPVAVYHFWSHPNEVAPYKNLRTPILLSIATLRAVSKMPVVVLDITGRQQDWGDFPALLNFKVEQREPQLKRHSDTIKGWPYLSRLYDINNWAAENPARSVLMYVDSDVFWFRDPEPFERNPSKFVFDGWNSGFFYYDFKSPSNEKFFDVFDAYTRAAIYSPEVRCVVRKYVGYDSWHGVWDEMILTYMTHTHPDLFNLTAANEHSATRVLRYVNRNTVKMFHCNGTMVWHPFTKSDNCRGMLTLLAREFHDNLSKVLDQGRIDLIFTAEEQEFCRTHRFGMFDDLDRLLATKDEHGHYQLKQMFSRGMI